MKGRNKNLNVTLLYAELKPSQTAVVRENEDGSYTILINKNKCPERQIQGVLHELAHIKNDDFSNALHADMVEALLHNTTPCPRVAEDVEFYCRVV